MDRRSAADMNDIRDKLKDLFEYTEGGTFDLPTSPQLIQVEDGFGLLTPERAWDLYQAFAESMGFNSTDELENVSHFQPERAADASGYSNKNLTYEEMMELESELKAQFQFTSRDKAEVVAYIIFMVLGLLGNISAIACLVKSRYRRSRIHLLLLNLTAADLIVVSVSIPVEIGWRISASWEAGDWACRIFGGFARAFPLYASSLIIVVISLDRYYTIRRPLRQREARIRARRMLVAAWVGATISALFQMIVFRVMSHPLFPEWQQCVTFGTLQSDAERVTYNLFCAAVMFFFPLVVIFYCYGTIFFAVGATTSSANGGRTRETFSAGDVQRTTHQGSPESLQPLTATRRLTGFRLLCRITEDMTEIERARVRAMKISVVIVLAFLLCWSPYQLLHFWYIVHPTSAENIPFWIQDALCFFAVSNSLVNPVVYGFFARKRTASPRERIPAVPDKVEMRPPNRQRCMHHRTPEPPGQNCPEELPRLHQHRLLSPTHHFSRNGLLAHHGEEGFEECSSRGSMRIEPAPEEDKVTSPLRDCCNQRLGTVDSDGFPRRNRHRHRQLSRVVVHSGLSDDLANVSKIAEDGEKDQLHPRRYMGKRNRRRRARPAHQNLPRESSGYQTNSFSGYLTNRRALASFVHMPPAAASYPEYCDNPASDFC